MKKLGKRSVKEVQTVEAFRDLCKNRQVSCGSSSSNNRNQYEAAKYR